MNRAIVALVSLCGILVANQAEAQWGTPQPVPAVWGAQPAPAQPGATTSPAPTPQPSVWQTVETPIRRTGFLAEIDLGSGGCTGDFCSDSLHIKMSSGVTVAAAYRLSPQIAVGGMYRWNSLEPRNGEASYTVWGAFARAFFVADGAWDPWVGLAVGAASFEHTGVYAFCDVDDCWTEGVTMSLEGLHVTPSLGVDFRIGSRFALGLSGQYSIATYDEMCFDGEGGTDCGNPDEQIDGKVTLPQPWAVALGARLYL